MKKLFFALVFLCSMQVVQAQYLGPGDASVTLISQAQALESGVIDLKNDPTFSPLASDPTTITATSGTSGEIPSLDNLTMYVYPKVLRKLASEITAANDTEQGITNAQTFFDGQTNSQDTKAVIAAAMSYGIELIN